MYYHAIIKLCLPELLVLRMLASNIIDCYTDQAKNENELYLKALQESEDELSIFCDGPEYMTEVNWPIQLLKKG